MGSLCLLGTAACETDSSTSDSATVGGPASFGAGFSGFSTSLEDSAAAGAGQGGTTGSLASGSLGTEGEFNPVLKGSGVFGTKQRVGKLSTEAPWARVGESVGGTWESCTTSTGWASYC